MEYRIESNTFWKNIIGIYNRSLDWHLADEEIQKISKKNLGLRYIETTQSKEIDKPYDFIFVFKVVNQDKLLWAKLKYGI